MVKEKKSLDWVPGLDELALRLEVKATEGETRGIELVGSSGRSYNLVEILANSVEFCATALMYVASVAGSLAKEDENSELNQKSGQPKKTNHPKRDSKIHKS